MEPTFKSNEEEAQYREREAENFKDKAQKAGVSTQLGQDMLKEAIKNQDLADNLRSNK